MNENSFDSGSYEVVYCCHPSMQILLTDVHLLFNKTVIATPIRENHECKCKDMWIFIVQVIEPVQLISSLNFDGAIDR